jgi:hypothetical protein
MAKIANVALTNTFETWRVRSNEAFDRLSQFAIDNSKLYANTLTANVSFVSSGATRLGTTGSNRTIVNGLLSGNGNLNVSGNTTLGAASKTLTIGGSGATANATGWFGVTGRQSISTNLFVGANAIVGGTATFRGPVNVGDGTNDLLTVTGRTTISQNLNVSGNTTLGAAGKTANVSGWFGVAGRATVSTNLFVGANTVVNGRLGIGVTAPTYNLDISSGSAQFPIAMVINQSTHATSRRAAFYLGGWLINQDSNGNGTRDFALYDSNAAAQRFSISTTGLVNINQSLLVNQNLIVSGNTTINGTTTDRSNALSQTLTDGATINWDTSLGRIATVTLGASRTIAAPTNLKVGTYILYVVQGGSGSYTLTWNSVFKWTAAVAPPLTTTVGARDVFTFVSDGTNLYGSFIPDVR